MTELADFIGILGGVAYAVEYNSILATFTGGFTFWIVGGVIQHILKDLLGGETEK